MNKVKTILAVLSAAAMLTACSGNKNDAPAATAAETSAAVQTEAQTEAETEAATEAQTEAQTEAATEVATEALTEKQADAGSSVFKGSCYSVSIDGEKWMDAITYLDAVSKIAEESTNMGITAEQIKDMCEAMYFYTPDMTINVNFTAMEVGNIDVDLELYGPLIETQYKNVAGIDFIGWEVSQANGYSAIKADMYMNSQGQDLKMTQYMFWENGYNVVATYTADRSTYDKGIADFNDIMSTISFE